MANLIEMRKVVAQQEAIWEFFPAYVDWKKMAKARTKVVSEAGETECQ